MRKCEVCCTLPIKEQELTIRQWERDDIERIREWSPYPFPYEVFNSPLRNMEKRERDDYFRKRENDEGRITLVVDHVKERTIGYLSLVQIDWDEKKIKNMGFRIAHEWCDQGFGTRVICALSEWCLKCGFLSICFDVAASNTRAVRCYEKAGYVKIGEFWRDDPFLNTIDISDERYAFVRSHVRYGRGIPKLRFIWMARELSSET
jgi:RimJ/RimL family protein N-acetyltransferase